MGNASPERAFHRKPPFSGLCCHSDSKEKHPAGWVSRDPTISKSLCFASPSCLLLLLPTGPSTVSERVNKGGKSSPQPYNSLHRQQMHVE